MRVYARFSPIAAGGPLELSVTPTCDRLTSTAALKTRVRSLSGARGEAEVPGRRLHVAERLRDAVAAHPIDTVKGPLQLTISVGVAGVDLDHEQLLDALGRADVALYAAKHGGRNRVVPWSPTLDPLGPLGPLVDD